MLKLASVMHMKKNRVRGSLSLLLGTTIWGFSFIAQSVGMDHIGPFTFQAVRCLLAVLFLIPCAFVLDIGKCSFRESAAKWKNPALWRVGEEVFPDAGEPEGARDAACPQEEVGPAEGKDRE